MRADPRRRAERPGLVGSPPRASRPPRQLVPGHLAEPGRRRAGSSCAVGSDRNDGWDDPPRWDGAGERRARARADVVGLRRPHRLGRAEGRLRGQAAAAGRLGPPARARAGTPRGGSARPAPRAACAARGEVRLRGEGGARGDGGDGHRRTGAARVGAAVAGRVSLAPALVALRGSDLAGYHGAEHVSIGTYERGAPAEREHERCGSHLVVPLVVASSAGAALGARAPERARRPVALAASLAAFSAATELFAWMVRNPGHPAARLLARPGHELQRRLATVEPTPEQVEVAEAALAACLELEHVARSAAA